VPNPKLFQKIISHFSIGGVVEYAKPMVQRSLISINLFTAVKLTVFAANLNAKLITIGLNAMGADVAS
jgi:hypothetical protein